jgi:response regulator RpfG family c-di-GMP phosphodiesterase
MSGNHFELGVLSDDYRVLSRMQEIASEFNYNFQHWKTPADFEAEFSHAHDDFRLILAAITDSKSKEKAAEFAELIRKKAPSTFIVCSVTGTLAKETAVQAKKAGANLILLEEELLKTSKLDYACSEIVRASYLAIKVTDLVPNKDLEFDVYHLLPQRQKFLKFAFEGDLLSEDKFHKIQQVGEIYISRNSTAQFSAYVKRYQEANSEGLAKRCRAEFLSLYSSFANLAFLLTDQSENASYREGETLMKRCRVLAGELLSTLAAYGNPFEIVNNSTVGEFGSVERTPAIAAYAGYFALQTQMENIDEIMMGALLGSIGILNLPSSISSRLRQGLLRELTSDEMEKYRRYPQESLDLALSRKLPLDPHLRKTMLSVLDPTTLVNFCTDLDNMTLIKLGKPRRNPQQALRALAETKVFEAKSLAADSDGYKFGEALKKFILDKKS